MASNGASVGVGATVSSTLRSTEGKAAVAASTAIAILLWYRRNRQKRRLDSMTIPQIVLEVQRLAQEKGALVPLALQHTVVAEGRMPLIVGYMLPEILAARPHGTRKSSLAEKDAFENVDKNLFIRDLGSHVFILNKFPIARQHTLIFTKDPIRQSVPLSVSDMKHLWKCVADLKGLGFVNVGPESGASQPRKHMQIIPLEALRVTYPPGHSVTATPPVDALISEAREMEKYSTPPLTPFTLPAFTFPHAACVFGMDVRNSTHEEAGVLLHKAYNQLLASTGVSTASHNVLLTPTWMMVVPRTTGHWENIPINALAFAGLLFVRRELEGQVKDLSPLGVLHFLSTGTHLPADGSASGYITHEASLAGSGDSWAPVGGELLASRSSLGPEEEFGARSAFSGVGSGGMASAEDTSAADAAMLDAARERRRRAEAEAAEAARRKAEAEAAEAARRKAEAEAAEAARRKAEAEAAAKALAVAAREKPDAAAPLGGHRKRASLLEHRSELWKQLEDADTDRASTPLPPLVLENGRVVPGRLLASTDMITVSHPQVMRLLIKNQSALTRLYQKYGAEDQMSLSELLQLCKDFNVIGHVCSESEVQEVFELVNVSEAADDDVDKLDAEEFSETLVRLAIYYFPGSYDLSLSEDLQAAVEDLLMFLNESPSAGAAGIKFARGKRRK